MLTTEQTGELALRADILIGLRQIPTWCTRQMNPGWLVSAALDGSTNVAEGELRVWAWLWSTAPQSGGANMPEKYPDRRRSGVAGQRERALGLSPVFGGVRLGDGFH